MLSPLPRAGECRVEVITQSEEVETLKEDFLEEVGLELLKGCPHSWRSEKEEQMSSQ